MPQAAEEQVLPAWRSPASVPAERPPAASGQDRVWEGGGLPPRNGRKTEGQREDGNRLILSRSWMNNRICLETADSRGVTVLIVSLAGMREDRTWDGNTR